eukprot:gnl/MRDRNA2_/MRDRNA2_32964_c0_seq1.p1 gnl/MRDRNA2_/MRDRNA2_32964_c0~~gnl/MRDRNA2_/MRDRNA2_32964_c0_seq1.p1  ORF type:complete len:448 (+),score=91.08 gnl/MRDRNA2_/MRDRNA2_32964_c0_seq1:178-1344(+)
MQAATHPAYLNDLRQKFNSGAGTTDGTGSNPNNSNSSDDGSNEDVEFKDRYKRGKGKDAFQRTKMCMHFLKGWCRAGNDCPWAHDSDELRQRPDLRKTRLCDNFLKGKCHLDGNRCTFAHSREELRATEDLYKTMLCRFWLVGNCKAGTSCRHAHGEHELRDKVQQAVAQEVPVQKAPQVPITKPEKKMQPPPGLEFMCEQIQEEKSSGDRTDLAPTMKTELNLDKCGYPKLVKPPTFPLQDPVKIQSCLMNDFIATSQHGMRDSMGIMPVDYITKHKSDCLGNILGDKNFEGYTKNFDGYTKNLHTGNKNPGLLPYPDMPMAFGQKVQSLKSGVPEPIGRPRHAQSGFQMQRAQIGEGAGDPLINAMLMKLAQMKATSVTDAFQSGK